MNNYGLTKKEKNYIISELICTTDSCNTSNKDFTIDSFEEARFEDFSMHSKSEFELIKSIIRKLNDDTNGGKQVK